MRKERRMRGKKRNRGETYCPQIDHYILFMLKTLPVLDIYGDESGIYVYERVLNHLLIYLITDVTCVGTMLTDL